MPKESKPFNLTVFGKTVLTAVLLDGRGWFRLFGRGYMWKDTTKYDLLFTERVLHYGTQIGKWRIRYLPKQ